MWNDTFFCNFLTPCYALACKVGYAATAAGARGLEANHTKTTIVMPSTKVLNFSRHLLDHQNGTVSPAF